MVLSTVFSVARPGKSSSQKFFLFVYFLLKVFFKGFEAVILKLCLVVVNLIQVLSCFSKSFWTFLSEFSTSTRIFKFCYLFSLIFENFLKNLLRIPDLECFQLEILLFFSYHTFKGKSIFHWNCNQEYEDGKMIFSKFISPTASVHFAFFLL